jgi:hypothetical protein
MILLKKNAFIYKGPLLPEDPAFSIGGAGPFSNTSTVSDV